MPWDTSTITKSDMYTFAEAPLHLWALKHGALQAAAPSAFAQILMEQGQRVEALARDFLQAQLPDADIRFQATLHDGPYEARLDALVHDPVAGVYDIYEVKSSTKVKPEALDDLTFQTLVAEASLPVRDSYLVLVNNQYQRGEELDLQQFLSIHKVTDRIAERKSTIGALRAEALRIAGQSDPVGIPGCYKPGGCSALQLCHPDLPEYPIYDIPRLSPQKADELRALNAIDITSIPADYPLTPNQKTYVNTVRSGQPRIDHAAIRAELDSLTYPLYFLDYEAFTPAIPFFPGYTPYRFITFQFSLHILDAPGASLRHIEYLNTDMQDPSEQLASELSQAIGPSGSLIVWYRPFEGGRNDELGERLPAFAGFFADLNARIYDLMDIFKNNLYVHPACRGSASIKNVLPVLCPDTEQAYDRLAIQKGDQAMAAWLLVTGGGLSPAEAQQTREDMLAYCRLDTLAMLKIWEQLGREVGGEATA